MNFLHLKYAIMVAETGSISKAAEKLYVAQPNVSRAIKELESDLNITIFERNSKGMIVTPEGEQLIHYAKRILRQIDDISISVPRASYISDAFVEFSKCLNNIDNAEVYYKETNAYRVINNVINEEYNLGILRYYINHDRYFKDIIEKKELKCELINQFKYVLIFNKNSALAENKEIHYSDLKDFIEIAHGDPYVPSLSTNELVKTELSEEVSRRIFVFERASQFELLANNEETFMWVSPVSKRLLDRYGLVQKECIDNTKEYKDLLIYRSNYKLSKLDQEFITKLCESKRNIN